LRWGSIEGMEDFELGKGLYNNRGPWGGGNNRFLRGTKPEGVTGEAVGSKVTRHPYYLYYGNSNLRDKARETWGRPNKDSSDYLRMHKRKRNNRGQGGSESNHLYGNERVEEDLTLVLSNSCRGDSRVIANTFRISEPSVRNQTQEKRSL